MKKICFSILTIMFSININAQINLQFTLDSTWMGNKFYCTDIGNNEFKYVNLDAQTNSFSLFNMDMSPYLTNIQIPGIDDSLAQGFTVIYVTKTLFDCDSTNIEYVFEFQGDTKHPFRIFRTDGTILLQVDSANSPYAFGLYGGAFDVRPIINTSDGAKLFIQKYDTNHVAEILIYALCGTLPMNVYDFSNHKDFVKIYPNPTDMKLNFEITPPNNQEEFQLLIIDSSAKVKSKERINRFDNKYSIDVTNYSNGTYEYSLIAKSKVYQSGKFIITK